MAFAYWPEGGSGELTSLFCLTQANLDIDLVSPKPCSTMAMKVFVITLKQINGINLRDAKKDVNVQKHES